jgi:hypothetical protein
MCLFLVDVGYVGRHFISRLFLRFKFMMQVVGFGITFFLFIMYTSFSIGLIPCIYAYICL